MQWFIALLLSGTLLEPRAFPSQSKLDDFLQLIIRRAFAAYFYNSLHVAALSSYQSTSHLELLIIVNLYVKTTCVLNVLVLHLIRSLLLLLLLLLLDLLLGLRLIALRLVVLLLLVGCLIVYILIGELSVVLLLSWSLLLLLGLTV